MEMYDAWKTMSPTVHESKCPEFCIHTYPQVSRIFILQVIHQILPILLIYVFSISQVNFEN